MFLTDEVKKNLLKDLPTFKKVSESFFAKEMLPNEYKGYSGSFGSYAERGADTAMFRLRLPGGTLTPAQFGFIADSIVTYGISTTHFTTGQSIQFHGLQGPTVIELFEKAHRVGIYSRGGGGDHPRNIAASPLRGVAVGEPFDISPYVTVASEYILTLIPEHKLPRKLKIAFSNGLDNNAHVTFKDLGFLAKPDGTFTVYAGGGLGINPRLGVQVAEGVDPAEILYYIKGMVRFFIEHGNYQNRSQNRIRYMVGTLGEEKFISTFLAYVKKVKLTEDLSFTLPPAVDPVALAEKRAQTMPTEAPTRALTEVDTVRILPQVQDGLYTVYYHLMGGQTDTATFVSLCRYLAEREGVEGRLTTDEGLYIINLTKAEAEYVAVLTAEDHTHTEFASSVCCIGKFRCQVGFQDSQALLADVVAKLEADGIDMSYLPKMHISGCPSSCGTHQIGTLGFHGFVKLVDKMPTPSFQVCLGGAYALGTERFGEVLGIITIPEIPLFLGELGRTLQAAGEPFETWFPAHEEEFKALIGKYL